MFYLLSQRGLNTFWSYHFYTIELKKLQDVVNSPIGVLKICAKQVRLDKVHHAVIFSQIVLHGGTSQYDPPFGLHSAHGDG